MTQGLCECGCGESTRLAPHNNVTKGWVKGQPLRFVHGHHMRGVQRSVETRARMSAAQRGRANPSGVDAPNWRGGRHRTQYGYVKVFVGRAHPMHDGNGYCFEHRLVVAAAIGRPLDADEVVHHINRIRDDNRLENLELFSTQAEHARAHREEAHA